MRSSEGTSDVATRVPSASGTRSSGACAPPTSSRCWQDDWYPKTPSTKPAKYSHKYGNRAEIAVKSFRTLV